MCLHVDMSGEGRERHKTGTIFTNTAALSMVTEEILLDDDLQKELASEIELWRLETVDPGICLHAAMPLSPPEPSLGHKLVSAIRGQDQHAVVHACASAAGKAEGEGHPDADTTASSVSDSEASSFAGFFEVPGDKGERPEKVRIWWRGVRPDRYAF